MTAEEAIQGIENIISHVDADESHKFIEKFALRFMAALLLPGVKACHQLYRDVAGLQIESPVLSIAALMERFPASAQGFTEYGRQAMKKHRDRKPTKQELHKEVRQMSAEGREPAEIRDIMAGRSVTISTANIRQIVRRGRKKK